MSVMHIVVIGAGVAGLGTALTTSRAGHLVTLIERDATPLPADPKGAFEWDRRGAPQVRHSHALLARLRNLLRDRHPDVLAALVEAGATEIDFMEMLPEGMDPTPHPGDEDLVALACRRTTFEWVLRRMVLAEKGVELRDGAAVHQVTSVCDGEGPPRITGVVLDDGTTIDADLVVAAGGRREDVPALLEPLGVTIEEREEDTGIIYYSRFFELLDDAEFPLQTGPIGGDLGYLKYAVFQGDNRTFSITFATRTDDDTLRARLLDPDVFLQAAVALPATAAYVDGRSRPITGVNVMARLLNRDRRFTDDGEPLVAGFVAVGDAHTCTNPLYGRGCSLAMVQAQLVADSLEAHGDDLVAVSRDYEAACATEIHPWYRAAVAQDRLTREDAARAQAAASDADGAGATDGPDDEQIDATDDAAPPPPEDPMRAMMRDGLLPAMRVDPVVLRAFLRMFNLLEAPDSLMTNYDVIGRVMQVYQDRDQRPPEEPLGPDRSELMAALGT
jgi:2-polyprenyl-6-methoxyphenol hydroxylase-like FAD-dependent oxidoreductase